jgi:hypothetical protein
MDRDITGVTNFLFDQLEEVDKRSDMEFEKKLKNADVILRHIWKAANLNLAYKKMLLQAPDIAQNQDLVLKLVPHKPDQQAA